MLESVKHEACAFVTLTYAEDHLPVGGTLVPKDPQDWLKRLRRAVAPRKVRFFLVGEYGDEKQRPHYHCALFGLSGCLFGYREDFLRKKCGCPPCSCIRSTWGKGDTDNAFLEPDSAAYLAKYVTKKMTSGHDPVAAEFLKGRHPEFARMSLKPGIGATAMEDVADVLTSDPGYVAIERQGDVPASLSHGKSPLPLGRYLRGVLRKKVGSEEAFKESASFTFAMRMRELYAKEKEEAKEKGMEVGRYVVQKREQKARNVEARYKIFRKKGSL